MTTVVAAVIAHHSQLLICQRRSDKAFPLKWEFPGGKVELGEALQPALARELEEELGAAIEIGHEIYRTRYKYPERAEPFELVFFAGTLAKRGDLKLTGAFAQIKWVRPSELSRYDFLEANADLILELANGKLLTLG